MSREARHGANSLRHGAQDRSELCGIEPFGGLTLLDESPQHRLSRLLQTCAGTPSAAAWTAAGLVSLLFWFALPPLKASVALRDQLQFMLLYSLSWPFVAGLAALSTYVLVAALGETPLTQPSSRQIQAAELARVYRALARFVHCDGRVDPDEALALKRFRREHGLSAVTASAYEREGSRMRRFLIGAGRYEQQLLSDELQRLVDRKPVLGPEERRFLNAYRLVASRATGVAPRVRSRMVVGLRAQAAGEGMRCVYCHDGLGGAAQSCDGCGTLIHGDCLDELSGCPSPGCRARTWSLRVFAPSEARPPATGSCAYCSLSLGDSVHECGECGVREHPECWELIPICTTVSCLAPQPPAPRVTPVGTQGRCAYCHDSPGHKQSCDGCGTQLHAECWAEVRECPVTGCLELPPTASPAASLRGPFASLMRGEVLDLSR